MWIVCWPLIYKCREAEKESVKLHKEHKKNWMNEKATDELINTSSTRPNTTPDYLSYVWLTQHHIIDTLAVRNFPVLLAVFLSSEEKNLFFFVGFLVQRWCQPSSGFGSKPTLINNLWIIPLCHFTQFKGCAFASQFVHSGIKTRSGFLHQYFSYKWNLGRSVLTSADKED